MKFKLFTRMLLVTLLVTSCGKDAESDRPTPNSPSGNVEITLTVPELVLPDSNPVGTLSFSASADWSVSLSETKAVPDWLTVEPMSGKAGQATLTITAQPNENYEDRSAFITIRSGSASKSLPVYQKKKNALILSKDKYELSDEATDIDVEVKSNIDFEVKILNDWITQVQTNGLTTHQLKFTITENPNSERTGHIVFKDRNSNLSDTISIIQEGCADGIAQDREALIALYKATNGDNWTNNTNWCTDKPLSEWYGVIVDRVTGRVNGLYLFQNNLTGYLPEEIGGLTEVISFDIQHNSLSGALPEGISSLMNGKYSSFFIFDNEFSGQLPKSVLQHPNWKIHWAGILHLSSSGGKGFDLSNVEIPAPDFTVTDLNGLTLSSATEYSRNKYTVFYHWATWCPFSHDFTVKMIPLYKAYQSKGLEIIGYSNVTERSDPHDDIAAIEEYITKQNIPWRNFAWDQDAGNMIEAFWYASYTPFVAVADQNGKIVFQSVTENYENLFTFLSEHLGEVTIEESKPYVSTDFSADGQVVTLQRATVGKGIDLVLMGDAFVDTTMIVGGIYEQRMREGMEAFFMEEPMKSLRNRFNVHMVKVVSENGNYAEGLNTALDSYMGNGTLVGGSDSRCFDYASRVPGIDLTRSQVVVIMNVQHYAGTCYMYEDNSSVAYFPLGYDESIFDQLLNHEAVGHGFGKLLDEYSNNLGELPQYEYDNYQRQKELGWGANTDITADPNQIRWAHFLQDNRYANEVGIYEGALTYQTGAWRSTENSIMRYNTGGFNAPSREALYKRVMELSGEGYSWERFVEYDAVNRVATKALLPKRDLQPTVPLHAPVMIRGTWRNARPSN